MLVEKRNGDIVKFEREKVYNAILNATKMVREEVEDEIVGSITDAVVEKIGEKEVINVEEIQDIVEETLMSPHFSYFDVAKVYIIYREKRKRKRELGRLLGISDDLSLGLNAATLLRDRYLIKDENGEVVETPSELFRRVAKTVAIADRKYDKDADIDAVEELFYRAMTNMEFLPNSPALMSAGIDNRTLAACFHIRPEDSLEDIFEKVKETAMITKMGGGVGLDFSKLRPKNDKVGSTGGVSSGPVSFMQVYDAAIDVCKQGSARRGALMGTLRCDSPDILEFIRCKQDRTKYQNFNISVLITDKFMKAYYEDGSYELINPRNGEVVENISARTVMDQIVYMAHNTGDPGLIFIDTINDKHPIKNLEITGINVCGEIPMAPNESCLLGAINLSKFVKDKKVDYKGLKRIVGIVVHFLDNMLDVNIFPLPQIKEATEKTRKIGVGIMGWAEMLIQLNIRYDSKEGLEMAETVMSFIDKETHNFSKELGVIRGNFPLFNDYKKRYSSMRNSVLTTIAPTGSRSLIAGTSSGMEPLYAIAQTRVTGDGIRMPDINKYFVERLKTEGLWDDEMKAVVAKAGVIGAIETIPKKLRNLFKTAHEISPEQHVLMQAAFQRHVGASISKTVNLNNCATLDDVKNVFLNAYSHGCKGITIFRDGCLSSQVLYTGCEVCEL